MRTNVAPSRINPGYRDETNEAAPNISITELTTGGLAVSRRQGRRAPGKLTP
ncbi:hypothetical protein [Streptomyces canus]|uniref:hypothetical protein n=1 Tax=Streptomyces canus TaxID=58343 RepID=UPI002F90E54C